MDSAQSQALAEELNRLANVGELAGPLAHEFNNFLNLLLLNIAVLEKQVPERFRADLAEVRKQGAEFANLVKQFQGLRQRNAGPYHPLDVNAVVQGVVHQLITNAVASDAPPLRLAGDAGPRGTAADAVLLSLNLAANIPAVPVSPLELRHLLTYLVRNAAAAANQPGGTVSVKSSTRDGVVKLRVEDSGPAVPAEAAGRLFEASARVRPNTNSLELAACKSIARRLGGTIKAENLKGGGFAVTVSFPVEQEQS